MDDARRHLLVYQIVSGVKYISIDDHRYKLIPPSSEIRLLAEYIYQDTMSDLRFGNLITKKKCALFLRASNIWGPQDDTALQTLEKHLEDRKIDLFKSLFNKEKQKRMRRAIKSAKTNLNKAYARKHSLDYMTLDYHALLTKKKFITALCLRDLQDNPIYTQENFHNSDSSILENTISILDSDILSIEEFRELARTDPWRTMWNLGKESCIANCVSEWSEEQKTLMTFAKMYENAHQSTDCPADEVFEDDDMFDGWMLDQKRSRDKDQKTKLLTALEKVPDNAQEVFVHAPTREEADDVYSLNDMQGRMKVQQRQQFLEQRPDVRVDAKDMPDTQLELRKQQMDEYKAKFRKG
tara:strand:- start:6232 stop:7290 length:1059 start_codon:yes stop_codon:yes gene_type:complete